MPHLACQCGSPVGAWAVPGEQPSPPATNVTVRGGWHPAVGPVGPAAPSGTGRAWAALQQNPVRAAGVQSWYLLHVFVIVLCICHFSSSGFVWFWSTELQAVNSDVCWCERSGGVVCPVSSTLPQLPCAQSPGAASAAAPLEKATLVSGNKQPPTKLCFIWEEHLGDFQELQKQLPFTPLF